MNFYSTVVKLTSLAFHQTVFTDDLLVAVMCMAGTHTGRIYCDRHTYFMQSPWGIVYAIFHHTY